MFLRKLLMFAITSGLAGKAWRAYRQRGGAPTKAPPTEVKYRAPSAQRGAR